MNILGIDFEDWFHPQIIQKYVNSKKQTPRIVEGLDKILELLLTTNTFATFFIVGELIKYKPDIIDKILGAGHEIGFHTMHHTRLDSPAYKEIFDAEIKQFAELTGGKSKGFRAPMFSLNRNSSWAIDMLADNKYVYDSSIMPVNTTLYGISGAQRTPYKISSSQIQRNDPNGKLIEFPLLTTRFFGKVIPAAGGFYLRFLPSSTTKNAIKNYEKGSMPAVFYIHSWELTPQLMPKIRMSFTDSFITYHNIGKAFVKMESVLKSFSFTSFERYISKFGSNL